MLKFKISQIIPLTILPITLFGIELHTLFTPFNYTLLNLILQFIILLTFWKSKQLFFENENAQYFRGVQLYLLWNIICIIRGTMIAENYWDWKGLFQISFALLVPILAFSASNAKIMQSILSVYIRFMLPLFIFVAFLIRKDAYGFYLVPVSFLLIFLPAMKIRWKLIILFFTLIVLTADFGARSNVIKFLVPIILLTVYYLRSVIQTRMMEIGRKLLIISPLLFFLLAISGWFNIFKMDKYIKGNSLKIHKVENGKNVEDKLNADTRTFLYVEVLSTAIKYNSWWIGRSPARGNETRAFRRTDKTGRGERLTNEVAILNILTWTGIIGIILYLFVFYKATYLAINQSNNIFIKILGLFVSFRWLFAWIEDVNDFNLTNVFIWFMLGLCLSKSFRNMTDDQVRSWVRGIFEKPESEQKIVPEQTTTVALN